LNAARAAPRVSRPFSFSIARTAMMERYELFVSAREAEALAAMLAAHSRANPFEAENLLIALSGTWQ
jgi:hypothetical protein